MLLVIELLNICYESCEFYAFDEMICHWIDDDVDDDDDL